MTDVSIKDCKPNLTVLLVDDDKDALEELQDIVELEGWTAIIAGSVDMALEVLEWYPYIGLVVTDVHFVDPSGDTSSGFQLISRAQARFPDRDLFYIVTSGDPWASSGSAQAGAVDFLSKPLEADALVASIHAFAGRGAELTDNPDRDENLLQKVQQTAQTLHENTQQIEGTMTGATV